MLTTIIVSIVFGSIIALAALICGTILLIVKTRRGGPTPASDSEEAKVIQEIFQGLERMESRIEALETILMDTTKREKNNES